MPRNSSEKDLSLKALELFQLCAEKGSLQAAAKDSGMSLSTVSHHLKSLEENLGVELFNHARRPLVLTPRGEAFLRNIDDALLAIRKAKAEASAGSLVDASYLRMGTIEDFDSDIIPGLAVFLARQMPRCDFRYQAAASRELIDMLKNRQLDLGVVADPGEKLGDLLDQPLLRDPFVMVVPNGCPYSSEDILAGKTDLPFLRFSGNLIIGRQIESQLKRMGLSPSHRFECSSIYTLLGMVAAGAGWTVATPFMYSCAQSIQEQLEMRPFPGKSFGRRIEIISTPDCSRAVRDLVDVKLRTLIAKNVIEPMHQKLPWLEDDFTLIS